MVIKKETLNFLKNIQKNNNKIWFEENKNQYLAAKENMEAFVGAVRERLEETDLIEKAKVYRIYRDVRFSKDKTPYKDYLWGSFARLGADRRGGYSLGIEPGKSAVGGGFYAPNKEDLLRIRKEFEIDPKRIQKVLNNEKFVKTFGELRGNGVKTAPRGFDPELENIVLIRKKQFYVMHEFSDKEILQKDFLDQVMDTYGTIRPYFDYMSEILTTNLNGESLI